MFTGVLSNVAGYFVAGELRQLRRSLLSAINVTPGTDSFQARTRRKSFGQRSARARSAKRSAHARRADQKLFLPSLSAVSDFFMVILFATAQHRCAHNAVVRGVVRALCGRCAHNGVVQWRPK